MYMCISQIRNVFMQETGWKQGYGVIGMQYQSFQVHKTFKFEDMDLVIGIVLPIY